MASAVPLTISIEDVTLDSGVHPDNVQQSAGESLKWFKTRVSGLPQPEQVKLINKLFTYSASQDIQTFTKSLLDSYGLQYGDNLANWSQGVLKLITTLKQAESLDHLHRLVEAELGIVLPIDSPEVRAIGEMLTKRAEVVSTFENSPAQASFLRFEREVMKALQEVKDAPLQISSLPEVQALVLINDLQRLKKLEGVKVFVSVENGPCPIILTRGELAEGLKSRFMQYEIGAESNPEFDAAYKNASTIAQQIVAERTKEAAAIKPASRWSVLRPLLSNGLRLAVGAIPGIGAPASTFLSMKSAMEQVGRYKTQLALHNSDFVWEASTWSDLDVESGVYTMTMVDLSDAALQSNPLVYFARQYELMEKGLSYDGHLFGAVEAFYEGKVDTFKVTKAITKLISNPAAYAALVKLIPGFVPENASLIVGADHKLNYENLHKLIESFAKILGSKDASSKVYLQRALGIDVVKSIDGKTAVQLTSELSSRLESDPKSWLGDKVAKFERAVGIDPDRRLNRATAVQSGLAAISALSSIPQFLIPNLFNPALFYAATSIGEGATRGIGTGISLLNRIRGRVERQVLLKGGELTQTEYERISHMEMLNTTVLFALGALSYLVSSNIAGQSLSEYQKYLQGLPADKIPKGIALSVERWFNGSAVKLAGRCLTALSAGSAVALIAKLRGNVNALSAGMGAVSDMAAGQSLISALDSFFAYAFAGGRMAYQLQADSLSHQFESRMPSVQVAMANSMHDVDPAQVSASTNTAPVSSGSAMGGGGPGAMRGGGAPVQGAMAVAAVESIKSSTASQAGGPQLENLPANNPFEQTSGQGTLQLASGDNHNYDLSDMVTITSASGAKEDLTLGDLAKSLKVGSELDLPDGTKYTVSPNDTTLGLISVYNEHLGSSTDVGYKYSPSGLNVWQFVDQHANLYSKLDGVVSPPSVPVEPINATGPIAAGSVENTSTSGSTPTPNHWQDTLTSPTTNKPVSVYDYAHSLLPGKYTIAGKDYTVTRGGTLAQLITEYNLEHKDAVQYNPNDPQSVGKFIANEINTPALRQQMFGVDNPDIIAAQVPTKPITSAAVTDSTPAVTTPAAKPIFDTTTAPDKQISAAGQETLKLDQTELDKWVAQAGKGMGGNERTLVSANVKLVMKELDPDGDGVLDMTRANRFRQAFGITGQITQADVVRVATAMTVSAGFDTERKLADINLSGSVEDITKNYRAAVAARPDLLTGASGGAYRGVQIGILTGAEEGKGTTLSSTPGGSTLAGSGSTPAQPGEVVTPANGNLDSTVSPQLGQTVILSSEVSKNFISNDLIKGAITQVPVGEGSYEYKIGDRPAELVNMAYSGSGTVDVASPGRDIITSNSGYDLVAISEDLGNGKGMRFMFDNKGDLEVVTVNTVDKTEIFWKINDEFVLESDPTVKIPASKIATASSYQEIDNVLELARGNNGTGVGAGSAASDLTGSGAGGVAPAASGSVVADLAVVSAAHPFFTNLGSLSDDPEKFVPSTGIDFISGLATARTTLGYDLVGTIQPVFVAKGAGVAILDGRGKGSLATTPLVLDADGHIRVGGVLVRTEDVSKNSYLMLGEQVQAELYNKSWQGYEQSTLGGGTGQDAENLYTLFYDATQGSGIPTTPDTQLGSVIESYNSGKLRAFYEMLEIYTVENVVGSENYYSNYKFVVGGFPELADIEKSNIGFGRQLLANWAATVNRFLPSDRQLPGSLGDILKRLDDPVKLAELNMELRNATGGKVNVFNILGMYRDDGLSIPQQLTPDDLNKIGVTPLPVVPEPTTQPTNIPQGGIPTEVTEVPTQQSTTAATSTPVPSNTPLPTVEQVAASATPTKAPTTEPTLNHVEQEPTLPPPPTTGATEIPATASRPTAVPTQNPIDVAVNTVSQASYSGTYISSAYFDAAELNTRLRQGGDLFNALNNSNGDKIELKVKSQGYSYDWGAISVSNGTVVFEPIHGSEAGILEEFTKSILDSKTPTRIQLSVGSQVNPITLARNYAALSDLTIEWLGSDGRRMFSSSSEGVDGIIINFGVDDTKSATLVGNNLNITNGAISIDELKSFKELYDTQRGSGPEASFVFDSNLKEQAVDVELATSSEFVPNTYLQVARAGGITGYIELKKITDNSFAYFAVNLEDVKAAAAINLIKDGEVVIVPEKANYSVEDLKLIFPQETHPNLQYRPNSIKQTDVFRLYPEASTSTNTPVPPTNTPVPPTVTANLEAKVKVDSITDSTDLTKVELSNTAVSSIDGMNGLTSHPGTTVSLEGGRTISVYSTKSGLTNEVTLNDVTLGSLIYTQMRWNSSQNGDPIFVATDHKAYSFSDNGELIPRGTFYSPSGDITPEGARLVDVDGIFYDGNGNLYGVGSIPAAQDILNNQDQISVVLVDESMFKINQTIPVRRVDLGTVSVNFARVTNGDTTNFVDLNELNIQSAGSSPTYEMGKLDEYIYYLAKTKNDPLFSGARGDNILISHDNNDSIYYGWDFNRDYKHVEFESINGHEIVSIGGNYYDINVVAGKKTLVYMTSAQYDLFSKGGGPPGGSSEDIHAQNFSATGGDLNPGKSEVVETATSTNTLAPTETKEPTFTATPSPTDTPTEIPTDTATVTPSLTPTPVPSNTVVPTNTPSSTFTPVPTDTLQPTVTSTPSPTETLTSTPTNTASFTATITPTPLPSDTNTPTLTATPTASSTVIPTNTTIPPTLTSSPAVTEAATEKATNTLIPTLTSTPSPTGTNTVEPTATMTPSKTPTVIPSSTVEPTNTRVPSIYETAAAEPGVQDTSGNTAMGSAAAATNSTAEPLIDTPVAHTLTAIEVPDVKHIDHATRPQIGNSGNSYSPSDGLVERDSISMSNAGDDTMPSTSNRNYKLSDLLVDAIETVPGVHDMRDLNLSPRAARLTDAINLIALVSEGDTWVDRQNGIYASQMHMLADLIRQSGLSIQDLDMNELDGNHFEFTLGAGDGAKDIYGHTLSDNIEMYATALQKLLQQKLPGLPKDRSSVATLTEACHDFAVIVANGKVYNNLYKHLQEGGANLGDIATQDQFDAYQVVIKSSEISTTSPDVAVNGLSYSQLSPRDSSVIYELGSDGIVYQNINGSYRFAGMLVRENGGDGQLVGEPGNNSVTYYDLLGNKVGHSTRLPDGMFIVGDDGARLYSLDIGNSSYIKLNAPNTYKPNASNQFSPQPFSIVENQYVELQTLTGVSNTPGLVYHIPLDTIKGENILSLPGGKQAFKLMYTSDTGVRLPIRDQNLNELYVYDDVSFGVGAQNFDFVYNSKGDLVGLALDVTTSSGPDGHAQDITSGPWPGIILFDKDNTVVSSDGNEIRTVFTEDSTNDQSMGIKYRLAIFRRSNINSDWRGAYIGAYDEVGDRINFYTYRNNLGLAQNDIVELSTLAGLGKSGSTVENVGVLPPPVAAYQAVSVETAINAKGQQQVSVLVHPNMVGKLKWGVILNEGGTNLTAGNFLRSFRQEAVSSPAPGQQINTSNPFMRSDGKGWFGGVHTGIDFINPDGTSFQIASAFKGEVVAIGNGFNPDPSKGLGPNTIFIKSAEPIGYDTEGNPIFAYAVYGHCQKLTAGLKVGDIVTAGEILGVSGSEGSSTGNHLHFELAIGHENAVAVLDDQIGWWTEDMEYVDPLYIFGEDLQRQDIALIPG